MSNWTDVWLVPPVDFCVVFVFVFEDSSALLAVEPVLSTFAVPPCLELSELNRPHPRPVKVIRSTNIMILVLLEMDIKKLKLS